jgi:protein-tyrosine phosphatase
MPSLSNFRDLGGVSLGDRRLRTGLFYRSARPTGLAAQDIAWLEQSGITAIVDFRGVTEREASPSDLGDALMARRLFLPVEPSVAARLRQLEAQGRLDPDAAFFAMTASYRAYVSDNLDAFGAFLQTCRAAEGAVVFHCSAGKDRTGFAAALLLSALGASWDDIMADYLRTRSDWQVPDDIRAEAQDANRSALLGVEPDYLNAAFDELDKHVKGAAEFAKTCLGGVQALMAFRERVSVAVE